MTAVGAGPRTEGCQPSVEEERSLQKKRSADSGKGSPSVPKGQYMEEAIAALVGEVRKLREEMGRGSEPLTVAYGEAARLLGLKSPKTISRMVKRGELMPVLVSETLMIPTAELRRIATPKQEKARRGGAPKKAELSAKEEAAQMLASLKRR